MIDLTQAAIKLAEADREAFAIILPHLAIGSVQIQGHEPPDSEGWVHVRPSETPDGMEACLVHLCSQVELMVNMTPNLARFASLRNDIFQAVSHQVNYLRATRRVADPTGQTARHLRHIQTAINTTPLSPDAMSGARKTVCRQTIAAIANLFLLLEVQTEWGIREYLKEFHPQHDKPSDVRG